MSKSTDGFGYPEAIMALAGAIAVCGFMAAASVSEKAKNQSPEYWHQKHHFFLSGEAAACTSSCTFIPRSRKK